MVRYLMIALLFLVKTGTAQEVFPNGGLGSYNLTMPPDDYLGINTYDEIGNGALGQSLITYGPNYQGPFETHQWWSGALWNADIIDGPNLGEVYDRGHRHSNRMIPQPLIVTAVNQGFEFQYRHNANVVGGPDQVNNGPVLVNLRVGFQGQAAAATSVDGYGDWHAVFRQEWNGDVLLGTGATGAPFFYFERANNTDFEVYHNGPPPTINAIYIDANVEAISITTSPQGSALTDNTFGIFLPPGSLVAGNTLATLTANVGGMAPFGSTFGLNLPDNTDFFSIAILPDNSQATLDFFTGYAFNFIRGTNHSYVFDEANSLLTTTFNYVTENVYGQPDNGTLSALFRHQWLHSPEAQGAANTGYTYNSPRGVMQLLSGNSFTTEMTHYGILPTLGWANTADSVTLYNYVQNYSNGLALMLAAADGYAKDGFENLLTAVQIAHQVGNTAAKNNIIFHLRDRLVDWLTSPSGETDYNRSFVYSPAFNHMSHYPNAFGSSGAFVDAHFHIGYLVMAAAILARYDQGFVNDYGDMVEMMIRSINDYQKNSTDPGANGTVAPWFPYLKYFDPYAGHSWAPSFAYDQESVSEALYFASGVFLWGETTQNDPVRDLGALLYTTEAVAAREYWYDVDGQVNGAPYANAYSHQHMTMVYNWGGNYATFFGLEPEWIHGITYVPFSGAAIWQSVRTDGAAANFAQIGQDYSQWGNWGQALNNQQAIHNPQGAIAAFNTYNNLWNTEGFPFTYHWMHTYDSAGVYDGLNVQADITGFGVFTKDTCNTYIRHYMMYNPPGDPATCVNFTDGTTWWMPEDTVITYKMIGPIHFEVTASENSVCAGDPFNLVLEEFEDCGFFFNMVFQASSDKNNWTSLDTIRTKGTETINHATSETGYHYFRAVRTHDYMSDNCPFFVIDTIVMDSVLVLSCGCDTVGMVSTSADTICLSEPVTLTTHSFIMSTADTVIQFQHSLDKLAWDSLSQIGSSGFDSTLTTTPASAGWHYYRTVMINAPACDNDTADVTQAGYMDSVFVVATPVANLGQDTTICLGDTLTLTAAGGIAYLWDDGSTAALRDIFATGTYTVTIYSAATCSDTDDISVTVMAAPVAVTGDTICAGETATVTATGMGNFAWNTGQTTGSFSVQPIMTTSYSTTMTSGGCTATGTGTVVVTPSPAFSAGPDKRVCNSLTIQPEPTIDGTWNYTWTNNEDGSISNPSASLPLLGVLNAGTLVADTGIAFYVTVTDTNNCSATDSMEVVFEMMCKPTVLLSASDTAICLGDSTRLMSQVISIKAIQSYAWNDASLTILEDTVSVAPLATTTYILSATDIDGGSDADTIVITVHALPVADAGNDANICLGDTATLAASGGESYLWNIGSSAQSQWAFTAGTYTVTTTDVNGCTDDDQVTVTTNLLPTADAGSDVVICPGDTAILQAGGGSSFLWDNGATDALRSETDAGNYTVTVSDGNGCTDTDEVVVAVATPPTADAGPYQQICLNENTLLTATGGTGYLWNTTATASNISVSPTTTTTYTVTATDLSGCTDSDTVSVKVHLLPLADIGNAVSICADSILEITANAGMAGYAWNDGSSNASLSATTGGLYIVTITDGNGCTDRDSLTLTVNILPQITFEEPGDICVTANQAILSATPAGGIFTGADVVNDSIFRPNAAGPGSHDVTYAITDTNGCRASDVLQITVESIPVIDLPDDTALCYGDTIVLSAGTPSRTYTWSNGETSHSISIQPTVLTTYQVSVSITGGCETNKSIAVTVHELAEAIIATNDKAGCYPYTARLTNAGTGTPQQLIWDYGDQTTQTLTGGSYTDHTYQASGTYDVALTVLSPEGCSASDTATGLITVKAPPVADFHYLPADPSNLKPKVSFTSASEGGVEEYKWSFGDLASATNHSALQAPYHLFSGPGTFTVSLTITDSLGCQDVTSQIILVAKEYTLFLPNAFSPNDDGVNETFGPEGIGLDEIAFDFYVYTRWGEEIYHSNNLNEPWNGKKFGTGKALPVSVYNWLLILQEDGHRTRKLRGVVTLTK